MNWLLLGGLAVAGYLFFKSRQAAGATSGSTWTLVQGAAPTKLDASTGKQVPIWYLAPVDPSQRWTSAAKQAAQGGASIVPILVVTVQPIPASVGPAQPIMVQVQPVDPASDGSFPAAVVKDTLDIRTLGFPNAAEGSWMPAVGTQIKITPSDVVVQVQ